MEPGSTARPLASTVTINEASDAVQLAWVQGARGQDGWPGVNLGRRHLVRPKNAAPGLHWTSVESSRTHHALKSVLETVWCRLCSPYNSSVNSLPYVLLYYGLGVFRFYRLSSLTGSIDGKLNSIHEFCLHSCCCCCLR